MNKITCWYKRKPTGGYYYNHYEDDWVNLKTPTIKHDTQDAWLNQQWLRKHTFIHNHRILE